jgi:hypothetical protein
VTRRGAARPSSLRRSPTTLAYGEDLVIDDFPYPEGLRLGKYCRAEILATLVAEPLLGSGKTREYVRSDIDVKFGPAWTGVDGELHFDPNLLQLGTRYPAARCEKEWIQDEQKWSPFRRYHKRLAAPGIPAQRWTLRAQLQLRAED